MSIKKYRISVFSLFRDSEDYIDKTLSSLDLMEDITNAEFEYFFYENDSKIILLEFYPSGLRIRTAS